MARELGLCGPNDATRSKEYMRAYIMVNRYVLEDQCVDHFKIAGKVLVDREDFPEIKACYDAGSKGRKLANEMYRKRMDLKYSK